MLSTCTWGDLKSGPNLQRGTNSVPDATVESEAGSESYPQVSLTSVRDDVANSMPEERPHRHQGGGIYSRARSCQRDLTVLFSFDDDCMLHASRPGKIGVSRC